MRTHGFAGDERPAASGTHFREPAGTIECEGDHGHVVFDEAFDDKFGVGLKFDAANKEFDECRDDFRYTHARGERLDSESCRLVVTPLAHVAQHVVRLIVNVAEIATAPHQSCRQSKRDAVVLVPRQRHQRLNRTEQRIACYGIGQDHLCLPVS